MASTIAVPALNVLPIGLRNELIAEFNKLLDHYRARRWEPSQLNAGKFSEVVFTIVDGYLRGSYPQRAAKPKNMVQSCRGLERTPESVGTRSMRILIPRILPALYECRNNRNVGHVGGDVDPNEMDATFVVAAAKWIMAELVRVLHDLPTVEDATAMVEAIVERDIPSVWQVAGKQRVLHRDLTTKDQILLLTYHVGGHAPDADLLAWTEYRNSSRFRALLRELHATRVVEYDEHCEVHLSPTGIQEVEGRILS